MHLKYPTLGERVKIDGKELKFGRSMNIPKWETTEGGAAYRLHTAAW
jgi:hypothetical protein